MTESSIMANNQARSPYATPDHEQLLKLWELCLTGDNKLDPHSVVLAECSEYFEMPVDAVRERCLHWEDDSVVEWFAADRSTRQGLLDFYKTQTSWIFDTMWYHANQCIGAAPAESVDIAGGLRHLQPGRHLDFGAGPGTSSMFFARLGWEVALADISTTFQNFARWRLQRHGLQATYYDTSHEDLPRESFDLITAFDVMVHVPNIEETLLQLHSALKPNGYFVFNIDNLPCSERTASHLYADQYPILGKVRGTGFCRHPKITHFHVYQKIDRTPREIAFVKLWDTLRYNQYVTAVGNRARWLRSKVQHGAS